MRLFEWGLNPIWPYKKKNIHQVSVCTEDQQYMKRQQNGGICKSRREAAGENNPAGTSIFDFQPPQLWENTFLLVEPPGLWYFVMAALENEYADQRSNIWRLSVYEVPLKAGNTNIDMPCQINNMAAGTTELSSWNEKLELAMPYKSINKLVFSPSWLPI